MLVKQFKEILVGNKFDDNECITVYIVTLNNDEIVGFIPFGSIIREVKDGSTIVTTGYIPEKQQNCMLVRDFSDRAHQHPMFADFVIFNTSVLCPEADISWPNIKQLLVDNREI